LINNNKKLIVDYGKEFGWLNEEGLPKKQNRELFEFEEKLDKLNLKKPW